MAGKQTNKQTNKTGRNERETETVGVKIVPLGPPYGGLAATALFRGWSLQEIETGAGRVRAESGGVDAAPLRESAGRDEPERCRDREKENGVRAGDARSEAESWDGRGSAPGPAPGSSSRSCRLLGEMPEEKWRSREAALFRKVLLLGPACRQHSPVFDGDHPAAGWEMMARVQRLPLDVLCGVRRGPRKRQGSCPAAESRTRKVARLQAPFLKVEDESRNFRPCQHQFKTFPELSFLGPKDASPFEALLFAGGSHPAREPWDAETSPRSGARRRTGYCECCQQAFEELHGHLQSARHLHFAWGAQSYAEVDGIIAQLSPGLADIRARAHLPRRPGSPPRDSHPLGSETVPHSQAPGLGATCPRMEEPDEQSAPGAQEWTQGHLQAPPEPVGTGETLALGSSCQGWACGSVGPLGSPEPSPGFVGCSSGPAPAPTGHEQRVWSPSSDTAQRLTMSPPSRLPPAPVAPGQHRANPRPFFPCTPTCACPAPRPASPCRDPSSGSPQVGGPSSGPHQPPGQEGSECPSS
ncbi:protein DBF4 homolog B isoform X2 [Sorex araneus]|uniref:protein DBF4 homolog B isoform X2 n=1 Tax=Sorex araneus TaxID=42254 RepID=UPI0024334F73|nr:protein DBF4 homolog B isoform X2 [Sorex araneus]